MTLKRMLAVGLLVLMIPAWIQADTIRLKNGSTLKGRVAKFDGKEFTIVLEGTQSRAMVLLGDILDIDFDAGGPAPAGSGKVITREEIAPPETPIPPVTKPESGTPEVISPTEVPPPDEKNSKEFSFDVSAKEVWVDSGVDLTQGQRVKITASGRVTLAAGRTSGPEGIDLADPDKLLERESTGGLIGVIGDDNDDFFFVGAAKELVVPRSGRLFLMLNEGSLDNNSGSFKVRLQVVAPGAPGAQG